MTDAERKLIEAALVAARFLPPPSFMRDSPGYKACKALVAAAKAARLEARARKSRCPYCGERWTDLRIAGKHAGGAHLCAGEGS